MKRALGRLVFFLFGWKLEVNETILKRAQHSVMIAAPHTSNWDFLFALCAFWMMKLPLHYFIKDAYTKGVFGWFFKWTGALGVNRRQRNNMVGHAAHVLRKNKPMVILVPAEGTRKRVEKWKTGFYHIARQAKVPVSLGTLNYPSKTASIIDVLTLSGDFEKDMAYIQKKYRSISGKHPENYNPQIF